MNKRDYFAAQAMQAIISKMPFMVVDEEEDMPKSVFDLVASGAYAYADAMIEQRNKEQY